MFSPNVPEENLANRRGPARVVGYSTSGSKMYRLTRLGRKFFVIAMTKKVKLSDAWVHSLIQPIISNQLNIIASWCHYWPHHYNLWMFLALNLSFAIRCHIENTRRKTSIQRLNNDCICPPWFSFFTLHIAASHGKTRQQHFGHSL